MQRHLVAAVASPGDAGSSSEEPELPDGLTPREAEVLALMAEG